MEPEGLSPEQVFYLAEQLFMAAKTGSPSSIEKVLSEGIDPEVKDKEGNTALILASAKGEISAMDKLHKHWDANLEARNAKGDTPLSLSVTSDKYHACKYLLEAGANPNATNKEGETPLYQACLQWGDIQIVKLLLDHGADPDIGKNNNKIAGQYPVLITTITGAENHLKVLLENGADPRIDDGFGQAIHAASSLGKESLIPLLIAHGASPVLPDCRGKTPLECALQNRQIRAASLLIKLGALTPLTKQELTDLPTKVGPRSKWNEQVRDLEFTLRKAIAKEIAIREKKAPEPTMGD
jgi:ankyrin repeat protein